MNTSFSSKERIPINYPEHLPNLRIKVLFLPFQSFAKEKCLLPTNRTTEYDFVRKFVSVCQSVDLGWVHRENWSAYENVIPRPHTRPPASEPRGAGPGTCIFWELLRGHFWILTFESDWSTSFKFEGFWHLTVQPLYYSLLWHLEVLESLGILHANCHRLASLF